MYSTHSSTENNHTSGGRVAPTKTKTPIDESISTKTKFPWYQRQRKAEYFESMNRYPSPTWSSRSHDKWASSHIRALDDLHENYAPPTHWATLKFNRPEPVGAIQKYLRALTRAIDYHNRTSRDHIAVFGTLEIDGGDCVHIHLLIRTTHPDPEHFFTKQQAKYNKKHGTTITFPYIKPPNNHEAVTKYMFKLGKAQKLLFASNSGLRFVYQAGGYFFANKADHEATKRDDYFLTRMENKAHEILGCVEDYTHEQAPTITVQRRPRSPWQIIHQNSRPLKSHHRRSTRPRNKGDPVGQWS